METLGFITALLFLVVSIACYIWLVVIAFKKGGWWGLAVLLTPILPILAIPTIIFLVKNWRESKIPFLTSLITELAFIVLFVYTSATTENLYLLRNYLEIELGKSKAQKVMQFVENTIGRTESSEVIKERENRELQEILDFAGRTASPQIDEKKIKTQTSAPQQAPTGYKPIAVTKAGNYIGKSMKVVVRNGSEHKGRLKNVDPDRLIFERFLLGGKFSFELKTADIKSLQVYR